MANVAAAPSKLILAARMMPRFDSQDAVLLLLLLFDGCSRTLNFMLLLCLVRFLCRDSVVLLLCGCV